MIHDILFIGLIFFFLLMAAPAAYGSSQAKGGIWAAAGGLHHGYRNTGSKLHVQPTWQLEAMLAPQSTEQGQGSNLPPHGH